MNKAILLMACGLFMAGCAGTPAVSPTKTDRASFDSLALQVMKANGYSAGLKDAEVEMEATPSSGRLTADTLNALLLREHLLGRATPLPGVPNSAMSAFFVLELFNDQTYLPRHGMWMPVWMPHHLARDPLEAQLKLTEIIEQAVAEALPADYRLKPYEWSDKAMLGAESSYRMLRVDGPLCENWSCAVRGTLSSSEHPAKSFNARMAKVETPSFIRDGDDDTSYRLRGLGWVTVDKVVGEFDEKGVISGHWHRVKTEPLTGFDHAAFYRRLSAALPSWAFIYFGPEYTHNEAGIPFVLNRGKELLFVKPAPVR